MSQYKTNQNQYSIRGETFLRKFDPMVQDILTKHYEEMGVHIHKKHPGIKKVELLNPAKDESDPREKKLKITSNDGSEIITNELLWAIGRGAETRGLGLENTGVKLDKTGHVIVDKFQETSVKGVYRVSLPNLSCGDLSRNFSPRRMSTDRVPKRPQNAH